MSAVTRLRRKNSPEEKRSSDICGQSRSSDSSRAVIKWWHFGLPENDRGHVLLLLVLYVLQGIPLGLTGSVPYILMSRHATYSQLATFSFAIWPFSLKLFWAPLVDCFYSTRFGRRKSWLVPVQYALGASMLWLSFNVQDWLGHVNAQPTNINETSNNSNAKSDSSSSIVLMPLTISFFWLNFLAATQDIVVDGWALTMLSRANVGWASTCNAVGQTMGYCIAFMLFLALESADFCNKWLRAEPKPEGIITFTEFLFFWAIIFLITNTLVFIFKSETPAVSGGSTDGGDYTTTAEEQLVKDSDDNLSAFVDSDKEVLVEEKEVDDLSEKLTLKESYRMLWRIVWLKPVQQYIFTLILVKIGVSATDNLTALKLIERGVSKETLAFLSVFSIPIQLVLPLLLSRYVTGPHPFTVYMNAALPRTLYGILFVLLVYVTPYFQLADKSFPIFYFAIIVILTTLQQVLLYTMFVCQMAFQAKVSDPAVGGTYMTFMNTIANLSGNVPATILMYLMDPISQKYCNGGSQHGSSCLGTELYDSCVKGQGECIIYVDGYYILSGVCILVGTIAIIVRRSIARQLENLSRRSWFVVPRNSKVNRAFTDDNPTSSVNS